MPAKEEWSVVMTSTMKENGALLLEMLTPGGIGLMVTNSDYRLIRRQGSMIYRKSVICWESPLQKRPWSSAVSNT